MILLGFGSRDWAGHATVASLLAVAQPSCVVHGACGLDADEPFLKELLAVPPAIEVGDIVPTGSVRRAGLRGADGVFHAEAIRLGLTVTPHPAAWSRLGKRAGMVRNGEMAPLANVGVGCVVGQVGQKVGSKGHYLTNGSDDMARRLMKRNVPLVVYRENGVEPLYVPRSPDPPLVATLRAVCWHLAGLLPLSPEVATAGKTAKAALERVKCLGPHEEVREVLLAVQNSLEAVREAAPQVAPWITPVELRLALLSRRSA